MPAELTVHRVGPTGMMAADHTFGVALVTLWHAVVQAGGGLGLVPPVTRSEVAAKATPMLAAVRAGTLLAVAITDNSTLIAAGFLQQKTGPESHVGKLTKIMVDPRLQRIGNGSILMTALLDLCRERGIELVHLGVQDGEGLQGFYGRFGFVECGRLPGAIRVALGEDRDDVILCARLDGNWPPADT